MKIFLKKKNQKLHEEIPPTKIINSHSSKNPTTSTVHKLETFADQIEQKISEIEAKEEKPDFNFKREIVLDSFHKNEFIPQEKFDLKSKGSSLVSSKKESANDLSIITRMSVANIDFDLKSPNTFVKEACQRKNEIEENEKTVNEIKITLNFRNKQNKKITSDSSTDAILEKNKKLFSKLKESNQEKEKNDDLKLIEEIQKNHRKKNFLYIILGIFVIIVILVSLFLTINAIFNVI